MTVFKDHQKKPFDPDLRAAAIYAAQVYGDARIEAELWLAVHDVNTFVQDGTSSGTVLHAAAMKGYDTLVKILIQAGTNTELPYLNYSLSRNNKYFNEGYPIHFAAENGHEDVVETLVNSGANLESREEDGDSALWRAIEHPSAFTKLLKLGADVHARNKKNENMLMYFLGINSDVELSFDAVKRMLDAGVTVNERDDKGNSPLMLSIQWFDSDITNLLLDHGADPNATNNAGETVMTLATKGGRQDIIDRLKVLMAPVGMNEP